MYSFSENVAMYLILPVLTKLLLFYVPSTDLAGIFALHWNREYVYTNYTFCLCSFILLTHRKKDR